jgi:acetoin utilization deacetylase AcuC-like enzyme
VDCVLRGEADNAYSLSRPPGHHCLADQAMGFCMLANIPIAIEAARARHGIERVAVVDWDVHHGNGTQAIYEERGDVLSVSLHQENCFPPGYGGVADRGRGAGLGANLNVPLPVACGYDANAVDPLARMLLHSGSFRAMTARLREAAEQLCDGRLVLVHEGGYAEAYVPFCGLAVLEELSGIRTAVEDPLLEFLGLQQPGSEVAAFLRQRVRDLARQLAP